jgi:hypothetical protein
MAAARGGSVSFQHSRGRWSRRHRERIAHERPLGRYGMGTTVLAPPVPDSVYRNRALVLGGLILLGGLGLGLMAAKIELDDEGEE